MLLIDSLATIAPLAELFSDRSILEAMLAFEVALARAQAVLETEIARVEEASRRLANQHAHTVMLGRTLLQGGPPITFGLKAAGWLGTIRRGRKRLKAAFGEALVLQFGGASGTLAALGDRGLEISAALAQELSLACPEAPWHTHRDRLAALMCACGVLTGSLGKIARDISLLMQGEVGEVAEASTPGRGGSSTMPHKRNPIGCSLTLAAAQRVPGLVASFLAAMVQEHERAAGGWQSEWPTVAGIIQSTGLAAASVAEVLEGLAVDVTEMRTNIEATHGTVFAERAMMLLAPHLGRDVAHQLLGEAVRKAVEQKRPLPEVLGEMPEVSRLLDHDVLESFDDPEKYLGVAEEFRLRLLATCKQENPHDKKE